MSSLDPEREKTSALAIERARKSPYTLVRVSERRYALVRSIGLSARGVSGSSAMYGVRSGAVVKGYERMDSDEAYDLMRRIDLERFDPEWAS